jgi:aryl-alcohol dehydrogenase
VGLRHTDLGVQAGGIPLPLPGVAGHEGAGVIKAIGPGVGDFAIGDKVLLSFTSCGGCANWGRVSRLLHDLAAPEPHGLARRTDSAALTRDGQPLGGHFFGQPESREARTGRHDPRRDRNAMAIPQASAATVALS